MFVAVSDLHAALQRLVDAGHGDALMDIDWPLAETALDVQQTDGRKWVIQRRRVSEDFHGPTDWGDL
jgi:hypothetical protein